MTKTDELKPCPFCGHVAPALLGEHAPEWWVLCQGCNASTKARTTSKQAVEQWNARAALQSQDREDAEFELIQDDAPVAGTSGKREYAWAEIQRYAAQYSEDGPVEIWEITRRRIEGE